MTNPEISSPKPAHTPGPWTCEAAYGNNGLRIDSEASGSLGHVRAFIPSGEIRHGSEVLTRWEEGFANARLIAAAPELLAACINARDMLATDRQAFVDCQQLRDRRTDDPIAHGLVAVEDGVWLDADDAEALRDYDRAIALIDKATAKATGAQA